MVHSFTCADTEALFNSQSVGRFKNIERVARRKLLQLQAATELERRPNMTQQLLDEIHPGEILLEEFMMPMGITARQLSSDMDVPPSRISDIVNGARPITADTALRLGLFFSMEPRYWLNLQTEYDMRIVTRESLDRVAPRIRVFQPAAS